MNTYIHISMYIICTCQVLAGLKDSEIPKRAQRFSQTCKDCKEEQVSSLSDEL